mmetsp:Transcript_15532/g.26743  ORF Transcript_15532/g.26743 Transcript_15532/m.26743 type:complete len:273 (-) Transcript_15532:6-824(-)
MLSDSHPKFGHCQLVEAHFVDIHFLQPLQQVSTDDVFEIIGDVVFACRQLFDNRQICLAKHLALEQTVGQRHFFGQAEPIRVAQATQRTRHARAEKVHLKRAEVVVCDKVLFELFDEAFERRGNVVPVVAAPHLALIVHVLPRRKPVRYWIAHNRQESIATVVNVVAAQPALELGEFRFVRQNVAVARKHAILARRIQNTQYTGHITIKSIASAHVGVEQRCQNAVCCHATCFRNVHQHIIVVVRLAIHKHKIPQNKTKNNEIKRHFELKVL